MIDKIKVYPECGYPYYGNKPSDKPSGKPSGSSGADGFSPIVTIIPIPSGNRITITDAEGDHTFDVLNGIDGVGIKNIVMHADYTLTITLTNGTSYTTPSIRGDAGNGIASIAKTDTNGLVDTYTITYTDGTTDTFTVTNGATGNGIESVELTSTSGAVKTYTITFTDGTTTTFDVTDGEVTTTQLNSALSPINAEVTDLKEEVNESGIFYDANGYLYINEEEE